MRTLIDISLKRFERVWTAGGETNAVFNIPVRKLIELAGGADVDVSEQKSVRWQKGMKSQSESSV